MPEEIMLVTTKAVTVNAFLLPVIELWLQQGRRVTVLCSEHEELDERLNGRVQQVEVSWLPQRSDPLAPFKALRTLRALARRSESQIVNVHTPIAALFTRWTLATTNFRSSGGRVVYTVHGFHFSPNGSYLFNVFARVVESISARVTDRIVTINRHDFDAAVEMMESEDSVVLTRGVGVDLAGYRPAKAQEREQSRRAMGVSEGAFVVGCVAELSSNKRQADLIEALARLPRHIELVLVGAGGKEAALRTQANSLAVSERVHFLGQRSDVPALLRGLDCLALVSKREGLPKCVLEGLASGLPVIGTDTRGTRDLVEGVGEIVPVCDPVELGKAIERIAGRNQTDVIGARDRASLYDVESCAALLADAVTETSASMVQLP